MHVLQLPGNLLLPTTTAFFISASFIPCGRYVLGIAIIFAAEAGQLKRAELSDWWHNGICAPVWNHPTLEPTTRAPTTGARHGKTLG